MPIFKTFLINRIIYEQFFYRVMRKLPSQNCYLNYYPENRDLESFLMSNIYFDIDKNSFINILKVDVAYKNIY